NAKAPSSLEREVRQVNRPDADENIKGRTLCSVQNEAVWRESAGSRAHFHYQAAEDVASTPGLNRDPGNLRCGDRFLAFNSPTAISALGRELPFAAGPLKRQVSGAEFARRRSAVGRNLPQWRQA
ncbi:MAG: hypothetical protein ACJ8G1_20400, partial [Vitreoscilla sp.]